jgi:hypothetical protein
VSRHLCTAALAFSLVALTACGDEADLDPADLTVRDLLGLDPSIAARWDGAQRQAARRLIERSLADRSQDERLLGERDAVRAAGLLDAELDRAGAPPWSGLAAVEEAGGLRLRRAGVSLAPGEGVVLLDGWQGSDLALRAPATLAGLVDAFAGPGAAAIVRPAPRSPFAAAWVAGDGVLLVNPVLLAALEPEEGGVASSRRAIGNPYNFFGSLGECAAAERARCESCLPAAACTPHTRDSVDGNDECEALAASSGRGYYQLCANLSLAIATVASCVEDRAAACPAVTTAGNQLAQLAANDRFLDDTACRTTLDGCLASIYGEPRGDYPGPPPDAGAPPPPPPPTPPRELEVSCGDCSDFNCDFDPGCSCETGSCEGGDCETGSCESCEGCDNSCDSSCGAGCENGDCQSGDCESGDCSGGDCSGGGCEGGSGCSGCESSTGGSGGCSGGSCSGSSSSSSQCSVSRARAPVERGAGAAAWALLPLVVLEILRRRERRRGGGR